MASKIAKRPPNEHEERAFAKALEGFDFEKVVAYMTVVDWRWGGGYPFGNKGTVPDVAEAKRCARELFEHTINDRKDSYCRSGGFCITRSVADDGNIHVGITFELEHNYGDST